MKKLYQLFFTSIIIGLITFTAPAWCAESIHSGNRTFSGDSTDCVFCHSINSTSSGPHGKYSTLTNKCSTCHQTHNSRNPALLPANSITGVCQYCHDLTQSIYAPYNFYDLDSNVPAVYSAHRVAGISFPNTYINELGELVTTEPMTQGLTGDIIPGGSEYDGGTGIFSGNKQGRVSGFYFSCTSCHSVHAVEGTMVEPYLGESQSKVQLNLVSGTFETEIYLTNRLLRTRPNNVSEAVYRFGTHWCLSCHKGRGNTLVMNKFNHHVNGSVYANFLDILPESNFIYPGGKSAALSDILLKGYITLANGFSSGAHVNKDPRTNAWYSMSPWDSLDRAYREDGNVPYNTPICQQCHGNPRDVEKAFYLGAGEDNPRRLAFPHVSPNKALLVEMGVDLCTNCHEADSLP